MLGVQERLIVGAAGFSSETPELDDGAEREQLVPFAYRECARSGTRVAAPTDAARRTLLAKIRGCDLGGRVPYDVVVTLHDAFFAPSNGPLHAPQFTRNGTVSDWRSPHRFANV
jgi:hypothetical protein